MIIAVAVIIVIWKQMPTNVMSINMEFKIRKFPSENGNAESIYWEAEHGSEFEISIWYICMSYIIVILPLGAFWIARIYWFRNE